MDKDENPPHEASYLPPKCLHVSGHVNVPFFGLAVTEIYATF